MDLSCHSWAFNDLTLPEALGTIARMGFRYVDLGSGSHFNIVRAASPTTRKAVYEELQADLQMFNLKLADVYLMLPRISISDETKRRTDIALFKAVLPMVKALGAPGVTVCADCPGTKASDILPRQPTVGRRVAGAWLWLCVHEGEKTLFVPSKVFAY